MSDIIQGSIEWSAIRCGKVTASRVADVIRRIKSGPAASRANYMAELLIERLTGEPAPSFMSDAMRWGTEKEPDARAAYEFRKDCEVEQIGFVDHPTISMTGASPDGLIGADGMVEIKCPNTATHIDTLMDGSIAADYLTQMQWQMACAGRAWCDFVSFDPRLPESMRIFIKRVPRDDKQIADLETQVSAFLAELDQKVAALVGKFGSPEQVAA